MIPSEMFITADDTLRLIATLMELTFLAWLIARLITFIPNLMGSMLKKIKNKSIIYDEQTLHTPELESNLDKSEMGLKTLIDRWFK